MDILSILKIIGAIGTALTGLLALLKPKATYPFTGLVSEGQRGLSEIRAVFGGLFIALGVAPFIFGDVAYLVLGFGYLFIAATRLASIVIDRTPVPSNWINLAIEIVLGIILIWR